MQRLAGIDAAFLYLDTPKVHMHVVGTIILDPGDSGRVRIDRIEQLMATRLGELPLFHKRLVPVPFNLDHPCWVNDPGFRPENHVRRIAVPAPGTARELADLVGIIAGRPLDRSRPLWELWTLEGLEEGRLAVVIKVHHAVIDGVSGTDVLAHLLDLEPDSADEAPRTPAPGKEPEPQALKLLGQALVSRATQPLRLAQLLLKTGRSALPMLRSQLSRPANVAPPTLPLTAPRTIFSRAISRERAVAFGSAPLCDVKHIKAVFGTSLNDVVLSACTLSLRRYLKAHGDLPNRSLVATVPVSVRPEKNGTQGNHLSAMFVSLPVHLESPVEQLLAIHRDTRNAKALHEAIGGHMLRDWAQLASPNVVTQGAKLYSQMRLAEYHRPIHNLVISNVPGPPVSLYAAGARVLSAYPLGPILEGAGLNITVLSYRDSMDFGVIACPAAVPDLWEIASGFGEAVEELKALAEPTTRSAVEEALPA